jgi:hypothetical protein
MTELLYQKNGPELRRPNCATCKGEERYVEGRSWIRFIRDQLLFVVFGGVLFNVPHVTKSGLLVQLSCSWSSSRPS